MGEVDGAVLLTLYVKRGKTVVADAEAICEAVIRPTMRFVLAKSPDQVAVLMLHQTRPLLRRQRTMIVNALRAHLAEIGIVAGQSAKNLLRLVERVFAEDPDQPELPPLGRIALDSLATQPTHHQVQIGAIEAELLAQHKTNQVNQRLETIVGVGLITATAIAATVTNPTHFESSRRFTAWLELTPKQNSNGGKQRLEGVFKSGDRYPRTLLIGATSVIRCARGTGSPGAS